ncbi:MAG: hypothetical protein K1W34_08260 [Lachnospiraceae bacterium]
MEEERPNFRLKRLFEYLSDICCVSDKRIVLIVDDLYHDSGESFVEEAGRKYFLLYLRPIINGTGNCDRK